MASEECGETPIKMSETISDYTVPPLSTMPIYLDGIPEIDTERSTTAGQTLAPNGLDGKDDRSTGFVQLPTSGNKAKQLQVAIPLCKTIIC